MLSEVKSLVGHPRLLFHDYQILQHNIVLEEDLKKYQALATQLDGLEVPFALKVGEHGELFESINPAKIVEKLKEMGFEVKKSHITLEAPIKGLGEYPVKIMLDHNLEAEVKLVVVEEKI